MTREEDKFWKSYDPTNSMEWQLAPCRFCKSIETDSLLGTDNKGVTTYHQIYCLSCGATGPNGETLKDAEKLWGAS